MAVMLGEEGGLAVRKRLPAACISAVNLSEVVAKMTERGIDADAVLESLAELKLDVRVFDAGQAERAGLLRLSTRRHGLSFGDRACLALAESLGCPAITADKAWAELELGIEIEVIR